MFVNNAVDHALLKVLFQVSAFSSDTHLYTLLGRSNDQIYLIYFRSLSGSQLVNEKSHSKSLLYEVMS